MNDILAFVLFLLFIGAVSFFFWGIDAAASKQQKEKEPFLVRLIDALSEESSQAPSEQSPYQAPEWSSSDPTQTEALPGDQACCCNEAAFASPKTDAHAQEPGAPSSRRAPEEP